MLLGGETSTWRETNYNLQSASSGHVVSGCYVGNFELSSSNLTVSLWGGFKSLNIASDTLREG